MGWVPVVINTNLDSFFRPGVDRGPELHWLRLIDHLGGLWWPWGVMAQAVDKRSVCEALHDWFKACRRVIYDALGLLFNGSCLSLLLRDQAGSV